jgi:hypothetical protein
LAIDGVFTRVLAKHSKSFSFIDCISVGVDCMQQSFESFWKPGSRSRSRQGAVSTDFTNGGYAMTRIRAGDVAARGIDTIAVAIGIVAGRKIYDGRLSMRSAMTTRSFHALTVRQRKVMLVNCVLPRGES